MEAMYRFHQFSPATSEQNNKRSASASLADHMTVQFFFFLYLPVSWWQVPCWWQLHGTQGERGPPPGSCRVKPGAHCSQNWPANPGGQEQDSTHGALGPDNSSEIAAEVKVTLASWDVSGGKEGSTSSTQMTSKNSSCCGGSL